MWKSVHIPGLTFANSLACLTAEAKEWLERGQREVGRLALGCHGRVAIEVIEGQSKTFRQRTQWCKRVLFRRRKYEFLAKAVCEDQESKRTVAVKAQVAEEETMRLRNAMTMKSTLRMYRIPKTNIKMEELYDDSGGSVLLFEALRTLVYRRHFDSSVDLICRTRGLEGETLAHLVLRCAGLCPRHTEGTTLPLALGFGS
ncbi:hypothetical protein HPB49_015357 [Dermacentor silvarum]|uniref:Uncharacterized protein n=1 Tax=Dermacentor silvarum TaxID=543639 RepID=A0ACB8C9Y5_DERSI|nr:hypothetical protein HPB49_015357 [Dermacentor silvarum]